MRAKAGKRVGNKEGGALQHAFVRAVYNDALRNEAVTRTRVMRRTGDT
jgi:hypothetical protein